MIVGQRRQMQEQLDEKMNRQLSEGLRLAANTDQVLYEDEKQGIRLTMGDVMEAGGEIKDNWVRAGLALMLENTRKLFESMDETTRLVQIGDFQKYAFNMVRALFPSLAAHELASVQPMAGPVSIVFYMKFIYNKTKGSATAGQDIIESPNESYSSELIDAEALGTGDGIATAFTGSLSFTPVRPGTVQIVAGAQTVTDDGNGNIVGDIGVGTNTINYATGAYNFDFAAAPALGVEVTAQYSYDFEANDNLPDVDMALTSSPVTAITRKLRTRWSVEAQQDLKNLHGLDAEIEQVAGITSELKYEIDRELVRDIKNIALNSTTAFSQTPPSGVSFTEHKLLFVNKIIQGSNKIFDSTQRAVATWLNGGTEVCSLIESLPGFVGAGKPANQRGIYKTGRLNGQWDIWKDPTYPGATRNAKDSFGYTLGYKGVSMWEVGYIFAPYILAFTTPTVMLDDFVGRKGIASRFGKKAIDGRFFCNGTITGDPFA